MALEALFSNDLSNFITHDTISSSCIHESSAPYNLRPQANEYLKAQEIISCEPKSSQLRKCMATEGRKKRRRKAGRVCKKKEEAETQRMIHITVERNRRKQMNEHLAVLRSLMPRSYYQRGDQASIVGGAIDFVKELEQHLQSLEAKKLEFSQKVGQIQQHQKQDSIIQINPPLSQFFVCPEYIRSQFPNKLLNLSSNNNIISEDPIADIEVTLIETHANLRILLRKIPKQLSKLVSAFHSLSLNILHLNVTTLYPLVLYSISAKVEEGCQLRSVDDIAAAVHHMLSISEEETTSSNFTSLS